jgi:hypothetical protein
MAEHEGGTGVNGGAVFVCFITPRHIQIRAVSIIIIDEDHVLDWNVRQNGCLRALERRAVRVLDFCDGNRLSMFGQAID